MQRIQRKSECKSKPFQFLYKILTIGLIYEAVDVSVLYFIYDIFYLHINFR